MSKFVCPICGAEFKRDKEYNAFIETYNAIAAATNYSQIKDYCDMCSYKSLIEDYSSVIKNITNKDESKKDSSVHLKMIGKKCFIKELFVGRPCKIKYISSDGEIKKVRTSNVLEIFRTKDDKYIRFVTLNSIYTIVNPTIIT